MKNTENLALKNVIFPKNEFMSAFCELLKIRSVKTDPQPSAPFGEGVKKALLYTLSLAESFGFKTVNYDNYIGEIVFGEGKGNPFGILCHLDVVPEGDLSDWNTNPYEPAVIDGKLYARGALDDKCGPMSFLFAMKALKNAGVVPEREIRLILGCDEESGWGCIRHYESVASLPEEGISPDADFPVIYAEKGIAHIVYKFKKSPALKWIRGGTAANVVCDKVEFEVENSGLYGDYHEFIKNGKVITSLGIAAHGSTPEKGKNALEPVLKFLSENKLVEKNAYENLFEDAFHLKTLNDETGYLTFSPDLIRSDDDNIYVTVDCRYPSTLKHEFVAEKLALLGEYEVKNWQEPLFSDKNGGLVKTLLDIYNEITGLHAEPVAIGGGTYARALKRGVAFGPANGEEADSIHKPNEYITLKTIDDMNAIYLETLKRICF